MRRFLYLLAASAVLFVSSCAIMDDLAGIEYGPDGKVISVKDNPITGIAIELLYALVPGGAVVGGGIGYAIKAYRRKRIIEAGGKDDNFDGVPDPEPPKTPVSPT